MFDASMIIDYDEIESEVMTMLKKIFILILALTFGLFISLYGVFLSVFADGNLNERLVLIAITLVVLFFVTFVFTLIRPSMAWFFAALIGLPGVFVLLIQSRDVYHILYSLLILLFCYFGMYTANKLRHFFLKKPLKNTE
jgi:lysylphosphatidylglycerol synthetase-like protein (DUF2156 family)